MSNRKSFFGEVFSSLGSAIAVAAALENGRQPKAHHLRNLGISPDQFQTIRRK